MLLRLSWIEQSCYALQKRPCFCVPQFTDAILSLHEGRIRQSAAWTDKIGIQPGLKFFAHVLRCSERLIDRRLADAVRVIPLR